MLTHPRATRMLFKGAAFLHPRLVEAAVSDVVVVACVAVISVVVGAVALLVLSLRGGLDVNVARRTNGGFRLLIARPAESSRRRKAS